MQGKNKRVINYKITDEELYYLAGAIDCASSFFLGKKATGRKDKITGKRPERWDGGFSIGSSNYNISKVVKNILFLGDSYTHTINTKGTGHSHRLVQLIRVNGPILDEIMPKLVSMLKIKKPHAEVILEFRKTFNSFKFDRYNPIPDHVEKHREELKSKMTYLNSKEYKDTISSPLLSPDGPTCCNGHGN